MQIASGNSKLIKFNKMLAYILAILCLSVVCGLAVISGSYSLTNTYDAGKVCDVRYGSFSTQLSPGSDMDCFWAVTYDETYNWNYLYLNIDDADFDKTIFEFQQYNGQTAGAVTTEEVTVGYNEIKLSGELCDTVKITATGDENISLTVGFMEFRENKFAFSLSKYLMYVGLFILIFTFLSAAVILLFRKKNWKIDWYAPIDFLQDVYMSFGNRLVKISVRVSHKIKCFLRIAALICWMFWIMLIYNMGKYMLTAYFKYNVLLFCITMLLFAISLIEKPLEKKNWDKPLVHAWLWISIGMCVSEFFISKRFCILGYVNFTVFGFYYFVWSNLKDRDQVIEEIMKAFKIAFLISLCFTLICRPRVETYGLIGHTWNPNIYGIFCGIVLMAFFSSIRKNLMKKNGKILFVVNVLGSMASLSFVILAGSRAGFIVAMPGLIFFFADYISIIKRGQIKLMQGSLGVIIYIVGFYTMHVALSWATVNLPVMQMVFPWDDGVVPSEAAQNIISLGMETPAVQQIIFNENIGNFLTARNLYWAEYLRNINFLGHDYYPIIWGGARYPHNGILGMVYRYGILIAAPYIIMFLNMCILSFRKYLKERNEASVSFYVWICAIGISLCMLVENFERPLLATEWLWWYWCIGFFFVEEE